MKQAIYTYDKPAREGRNFMTCGELIEAIEQSETHFRPLSYWFGGIDVHHVSISRIFLSPCKQFAEISWSS